MKRHTFGVGLVVLQFAAVAWSSVVQAEADYTFITYCQGDNDLYPFATYNMDDMTKVGSNAQLNILVQLDKPQNNGTWRYRIDKGALTLDQFLSYEMGQNPGQELVDMIQKWVVPKYSAKKYVINLWNHGAGVIDRVTELLGRGILFDYAQNTYLNNKHLRHAMNDIREVLGRNIDMVAMDACLMAMIEIGWELAPSTDYLVAAEQTIPVDGFPYSKFLPAMASGNPSIETVARAMVAAYGEFYQQRGNVNLSAIRLGRLGAVKEGLNAVISAIAACTFLNLPVMSKALRKARKNAVSYETPSYVDICSWLGCLTSALNALISETETKSLFGKAVAKLNDAIAGTIAAVKACIVAQVAIAPVQNSTGLSIYYPTDCIHPSYFKTKFAKESLWVPFLLGTLGVGIFSKDFGGLEIPVAA